MDFSLLQPLKVPAAILVIPFGNLISVRLIQPPNASQPIFMIVSGISMPARLSQPQNVESGIIVRFLGMFILVRFVHPEKTLVPRLSIPSGNTISVILLQSLKAPFPMDFTPSGIFTFFRL